MTKNIEEKIEKLRKKIDKWNEEYYLDDNPSIDDAIYDKAMNELIDLEKKYPNLITINSPTQKVGIFLKKTSFKKEEHNIEPMLSLKNAFNEGDIFHFDEQIKKENIKDFSYYIEPKIDGLSISISYKNGKLVRALTRGDGKIGENVTQNIYEIKSIPKEIFLKDEIEVRGEVYISLESFEEINKKRILKNKEYEKKGRKPLELFANPRNAAAGTLRQLNSYIVRERKLDAFFFFLLFKDKTKGKETQEKNMNLLKKLGFTINSHFRIANNVNEVMKSIKEISNLRDDLNYEIDGIVIKLNEIFNYEKLGVTSKFPKWAIAYKFPTEIKETKLLKIFPTIGRTGRVTYNAQLEKITLLGSNVQKATLHNANYIKGLNINEGDYVLVKKAGDIIPKVIGLSLEKFKVNKEEWKEAKNCPSCNSELKIFEGEVDQYCININCPDRILEIFIHFVSKKAMNIEGLSIKQIEKFRDLGWIKKITDIYNLENHKEELLNMDGYKEKSVNNLLSSIENSKNQNLNNVLFSLGIRHIGEKTSFDLARKYKDLEIIRNLKYDELLKDDDFGEVKSGSIIKFFENKENIEIIKELKEKGINFIYKESILNRNNFFYNKKILITGTIQGATRIEIKNLFISYGAIPVNTVTKDLDYLIVGENPSNNKLNKISKDKIIEIIDINQLKQKYG
ncbi:MAG: DNA ligase [Candidatus Hepatoplasma vulgare]|nr:MAG: DNA ligase [Candidatus Hepatoplasma sp.]